MPSSVIKAWRYDAPGQALTITFVSGRVYVYRDVPADVAEGLRLAFAKGEYFNKVIRDRFIGAPVEVEPDRPKDRFFRVRRVAFWRTGSRPVASAL